MDRDLKGGFFQGVTSTAGSVIVLNRDVAGKHAGINSVKLDVKDHRFARLQMRNRIVGSFRYTTGD